MTYKWHYFTLEDATEFGKPTAYVLVDEERQVLCNDIDDPYFVTSHGEAEDLLEDLDIRGNVR